MRIIAGTRKGRKLHAVGGLPIRPTADRLRESVFNILAGEMAGAVVLDLFAGTGSMGMEALSRGAESCVFVEKNAQAVNLIRRNLTRCGLAERAQVVRRDILRGLDFLNPGERMFDTIFLDPPYNQGYVTSTLLLLDRYRCLHPEGRIVVEHSRSEDLPEEMTHLWETDRRRYGKTLVSFYRSVV
jgi:16S rRNA (guanine(966)-N(2))-methyltransferase RsmD